MNLSANKLEAFLSRHIKTLKTSFHVKYHLSSMASPQELLNKLLNKVFKNPSTISPSLRIPQSMNMQNMQPTHQHCCSDYTPS